MSIISEIEEKYESAKKAQAFLPAKRKALDARLGFGMQEYKNDIREAIRKPYRPTKFQEVQEEWVSEMRMMKPKMTVESENGDDEQGEDKAVALQELLKWYENKANAENAIDCAFEEACGYGFGAVFDYYDFVNATPVCEWVDWRELFIDPRAKTMEKAQWILRKRKYTKKEFEKTFGADFEMAKSQEDKPMESNSPLVQENHGNNVLQEDEVYLYDYYSIEDKKHIVFCSMSDDTKKVLFEEEYILSKVPITLYYHIKKNESLWGVSPIEKGSPSIDLDMNMTNLALKSVKASLTPAMIVDGSTGISSSTKLQPGGVVVTSKGSDIRKIGDAIQKIDFSANLGGFQYIRQILDQDEVSSTKMDKSLSSGYPEKVGIAKLQAQSKNKYVNSLVEKMLISSEKWRTEHLIELMQKIIIPHRENPETNGEKVKLNVKGYFVLKEGSETPRFLKNGVGRGSFEVSEKSIAGDFSAVATKAKDKEILKEEQQKNFVNLLDTVQRLAQLSPEILQKINWEELLEEGFEMMDIDKKKILAGTTEAGKDIVAEEHSRLMKLGKLEFPEGETPEESEKHLTQHIQFLKENEKELDGVAKAQLISHITKTAENVRKM